MNKDIARKLKLLTLALYVPLYIGLFFLVENMVPSTADYWVSYCKLDDFIPFCEYFIVPYCLWYGFMVVIGVFLLIKDEEGYKRYMYSIMITFTFTLIFCLAFPNGQDLRVESFPRDNIFSRMIANIYATDTNTNVIPSVHGIGAFLGAIAIIDTKTIRNKLSKAIIVTLAMTIAISTCFVKQHSILDIFASAAICAIIYTIIYILFRKENKILKNS